MSDNVAVKMLRDASKTHLQWVDILYVDIRRLEAQIQEMMDEVLDKTKKAEDLRNSASLCSEAADKLEGK